MAASVLNVSSITIFHPINRTSGWRTESDYFESCGNAGLYCSVPGAPTLRGQCGDWLGQKDYCCFISAYQTGRSSSVLLPCNGIPEINNTPFEQFENAAYTYKKPPTETNSCPNGDKEIKDTDIFGYVVENGSSVCCKTDNLVVLEEMNAEGELYDKAYRCGEWKISASGQEVQQGSGESTSLAAKGTSKVSSWIIVSIGMLAFFGSQL
ncbi:hypothetical protein H072_11120 [Dactylellina haptotyla CBS 200.50]|uniref:Uncharacterized protein n=1 Tax=Dactylellina haptotyla (strain CBS 200.50) TaxID=1284197 RepID=S8A2V3_DACHA|nr:hypothetical protein H072_11120 [Dactylellina haptotyla CBS 200.50]